MQWWENLGSAAAAAIITALIAAATGVRRGRAKRRREWSGWSCAKPQTWHVMLVTSEPERDIAVKAIRNGGPSEYIALRVPGGPGSVESLRQLLHDDPYLARCPTLEERQALERGLKAGGVTGTATSGETPSIPSTRP